MKQTKDIAVIRSSKPSSEIYNTHFNLYIGTNQSLKYWKEILLHQEYIESATYIDNKLPIYIIIDPRFEGKLTETLQELFNGNDK